MCRILFVSVWGKPVCLPLEKTNCPALKRGTSNEVAEGD